MKFRNVIPFLLGAILLIGCLPSTPAADMNAALTQAVATLNASLTQTAEAPASVPGTQFEGEGIRFTIPVGVAGGATAARVPGQNNQDVPYWGIYPDYREITLVNYVLGAQFHDPVIRVYPTQAFASINEAAATDINDLQAVFANPGSIADLRSLPFLPVFNAGQMFHAQTRLMEFADGQGLRYLTLFAQFYAPINNSEMVYTFQAITGDGAYYISVLLPVHAPFLAADGNPNSPVPVNGIAYPDFNSPNLAELYQSYVRNVSTALNQLANSAYSPTLDALDALARSIEVLGP